MDQTIERAPPPVSDRAGSMPTGSLQAHSPRPPSTQAVAEPGSTSAGATASGETRRRSSAADGPGGALDAKEAAAAPAVAPALKDDERAAERKVQAKRPSDAPAPFPASEQRRESEKATATASPAREAAKKEADIGGLRADAMTQPSAPPAAPSPVLRQTPSAPPEATAAARPAAVVGGAAPAPTARMQSGSIAAAPSPAAPLQGSSIDAAAVPPAPFQGSGIASETGDAHPTGRADAPPAKSAAAPPRAAAAARDAPPSARNATDSAQDALTLPTERAQRQRALTDSRDKDVAALAASPPAPTPFRNELARSRSDAMTRSGAAAKSTPPPAVIGAIAAEPDRWSRQASAGDVRPLEPGWRRWLAELDSATAGRWRSAGPGGAAADSNDRAAASRPGTPGDRANRADAATGADPERDRATTERPTTLRLVDANRATVVIRVDGATVHVETASQSGAEHWQATLDPAATDALRAAARRLPP